MKKVNKKGFFNPWLLLYIYLGIALILVIRDILFVIGGKYDITGNVFLWILINLFKSLFWGFDLIIKGLGR